MNQNIMNLLMSKSKVDERRVNMMYHAGASNEEVRHHTAYEWANAVDEVIGILQKQAELLTKVNNSLDCYEKAQGCVEAAIWQIEQAIANEDAVLGRFWAEQPEDFERCGTS